MKVLIISVAHLHDDRLARFFRRATVDRTDFKDIHTKDIHTAIETCLTGNYDLVVFGGGGERAMVREMVDALRPRVMESCLQLLAVVSGDAAEEEWVTADFDEVLYEEEPDAVWRRRLRLLQARHDRLSRQREHWRAWAESSGNSSLEQDRYLLTTFLDTVPDYIYFKDEKCRFTRVNRALIKRHRVDGITETIGRTDHDFFTPEHANQALMDEQQVMRTGRPLLHREERETWVDGRVTWVSTSKFPLRDRDGRVVGTFGISTDITERKEAQQAIENIIARVECFLWSAKVIAHDGDLTWSYKTLMSNPIRERLGIGKGEEDPGSIWPSRVFEEDLESMHQNAERALSEGKSGYRQEFRIRASDGTTRWLSETVEIHPIDDAGWDLVGVVTDITAIKEAEEQRLALERKMLDSQKLESLGVLAGGVAHDFNNLLTAIMGNTSIALMKLPPDSPVQGALKNIENVAIRAADLCKQMLAYTGRGAVQYLEVDVNDLVEQMFTLLKISISKSVVLKLNLFTEIPKIHAEPAQLQQVIMNLVINASEAIGEKSGVITVSTGMKRLEADVCEEIDLTGTLEEGDYLYIEVSDTGCGMSAETQARVFDPFFTTKFTGRGLGLAAVHGILQSHKGAIKVYSEPGRGTTMKVFLPAVRKTGVAPTGDPSERSPSWRGEGLLLVVDDEESVRTTTARMLEALGYSVLMAEDGKEAVDLFSSRPDDITAVLLDLTMPRMGGAEAFGELRRIRPGVKVIVMSGYSETDVNEKFAGKGLSGFLQKPFRSGELIQMLRKVMGDEQAGTPAVYDI